ncbi:hypothetical protein ABIF61_001432 [Bradyrhizobium japonicum]
MRVSIKICRTIVTPVQVDRSLNLDGSRLGRLAASDHPGPRGPRINRGPRCCGEYDPNGISGNVQRGMVACRRGSLAGHQHRARLSAHAAKRQCGRERAEGLALPAATAARGSAFLVRAAGRHLRGNEKGPRCAGLSCSRARLFLIFIAGPGARSADRQSVRRVTNTSVPLGLRRCRRRAVRSRRLNVRIVLTSVGVDVGPGGGAMRPHS